MKRTSTMLVFVSSVLLLTLVLTPIAETSAQVEEGGWLGGASSHYREWGRVDDELRWAPFLCRLPMASRARMSAGSARTHGRKVYFVYASDRAAYLSVVSDSAPPPRGLTVVKEAFIPRPVAASDEGERLPIPGAPAESPPAPDDPLRQLGPTPNVYTPLRDEHGQLLGAGAPAGLFAMRYVGQDVPGTDAGWQYGTLDPSGTITSSGIVERCVGCHRDAPHGRLFGLEQTDRE